MQVKPSTEKIFTVYDLNTSFIVKMEERKCTCNRFQIDELPYSHALAILKQMNQDPYRYYSHFYTKEALLETYKETIHLIPNQATWKNTT